MNLHKVALYLEYIAFMLRREEPMAKERTVTEIAEPATKEAASQNTNPWQNGALGGPQKSQPNPEFQLLARIDRMLSRVPPEVANRILSMLAAQRMGMSLAIVTPKQCNSVPLG